MVFSKPSASTFTYKGLLPSAVMNAVNNDFPNCVDKTGETVAGGGGVSGQIDIASGGSVQARSGSTINVQSGGTFSTNAAAAVNISVGGISSYITVSNLAQIGTSGTGKIQSGTAGSIQLGGGSADWVSFTLARTASYTRSATQQFVCSADFVAHNYYVDSAGGGADTAMHVVPHHGATLSSVSVSFTTSGTAWTILPGTFPVIQVIRMKLTDLTQSDLYSGSVQAYPSEILSVWNNGLVKTLTIVCNQNNVIDTSQYLYFCKITDDTGGTSADKHTKWQYCTFNYSTINNTQFTL